jgi:hypothetical protein
MSRPSAPVTGISDVWNTGEYRNYVRNMMTNFGSEYNRRREAENAVSRPGWQMYFTLMNQIFRHAVLLGFGVVETHVFAQ